MSMYAHVEQGSKIKSDLLIYAPHKKKRCAQIIITLH